MQFLDTIFRNGFNTGLVVSQTFAVLLYLSIFFLMLWTLGQTALHLLG